MLGGVGNHGERFTVREIRKGKAMFVIVPKLLADQVKRYESLASEVVNDAIDRGDEEYAEGILDDVVYQVRAEWFETCCVGLFCPGQRELRGQVTFAENGYMHYVRFTEYGYSYRYSRVL
jgi:hypothetical protein